MDPATIITYIVPPQSSKALPPLIPPLLKPQPPLEPCDLITKRLVLQLYSMARCILLGLLLMKSLLECELFPEQRDLDGECVSSRIRRMGCNLGCQGGVLDARAFSVGDWMVVFGVVLLCGCVTGWNWEYFIYEGLSIVRSSPKHSRA
jgi:hypothetical protein